MKASLLFFIILLWSFSLYSNENKVIWLKSGHLNFPKQNESALQENAIKYKGEIVIICFERLPGEEIKNTLSQEGIELYSYLPHDGYFARISKDVDAQIFNSSFIHSINLLKANQKLDPSLQVIPEYALHGDEVKVNLHYLNFTDKEEIKKKLKTAGFRVSNLLPGRRQVEVSTKYNDIRQLASLDFTYFISWCDAPSFPENYGGRSQHRSNMAAQEFRSGRHYDGSGVNVGMIDDGMVGPHIDYQGRVTHFTTSNAGNHGDHVGGTIMSAGNLDPKGRGMAFGAHLYVYRANSPFSNANYYLNSVAHYNTYDIYITSKSYSNGCNDYTDISRYLDSTSWALNSMIHVFSAGNSGTSNCGYGAGAGWGNITGGTKMGKNVIATGNLNSSDQLRTSSSRGPASDGRIKPDICAKGSSVYSTVDENDYDYKTGTSMSAPGISGCIAQLYHAYKDQNGGVSPNSGLIKGILLNTADDIGNPGPDFKHGWGRVNLRRALDVLENQQYIAGSISTIPVSHSLSVPANLKELRVMVYWHDYEGDPAASKALVNDIDMTLTDPSSNVYYPWILNPTPNSAALDSNAKRGIDTLNNVEQVSIENPSQGTYALNLYPTSIPQGPQSYHVVYEYIFDEIYLTYPNGGEGLVPGETETIRWDAPGNSGTFTLEYSTDGGNSWNTISSSVNSTLRQYDWNVPNDPVGNAMVRVKRGLITDESDAEFSIIGVPQNLRIVWECGDSVKIAWNDVDSALDYTTYMLGNKYMDSIDVSNATDYVFTNLNQGNKYWFSVASNTSNSSPGRRAYAIQSSGKFVDCPLANDIAISRIASPSTGTYPTCVVDSVPLKVYLKNTGLDTVPLSSISCQVYGTGTLAMTSSSIAPGDSVLITHTQKIDLSTALAEIKCILMNSGDQNPYNDTSFSRIDFRNVGTVNSPWSEDFESNLQCGTDNNCGTTICAVNDWINDSTYFIDEHDWRLDLNGTNSGQTGPVADHNPGEVWGKYIYTEASGTCNEKTTMITSPCLELTDMGIPRLTWWYHMYGVEMGSLHLDLLTQDGWVLDIAPPRFGNQGDLWVKDSVDLEDYAGETVSFRFRGKTGPGYRSDIAVDDINLFEGDPYYGIEKREVRVAVNVYPNPGHGIFYLEYSNINSRDLNLTLRDIAGKEISDSGIFSVSDDGVKIDMTSYHSGTYLLEIRTSKNTYIKKLIKL